MRVISKSKKKKGAQTFSPQKRGPTVSFGEYQRAASGEPFKQPQQKMKYFGSIFFLHFIHWMSRILSISFGLIRLTFRSELRQNQLCHSISGSFAYMQMMGGRRLDGCRTQQQKKKLMMDE